MSNYFVFYANCCTLKQRFAINLWQCRKSSISAISFFFLTESNNVGCDYNALILVVDYGSRMV